MAFLGLSAGCTSKYVRPDVPIVQVCPDQTEVYSPSEEQSEIYHNYLEQALSEATYKKERFTSRNKTLCSTTIPVPIDWSFEEAIYDISFDSEGKPYVTDFNIMLNHPPVW